MKVIGVQTGRHGAAAMLLVTTELYFHCFFIIICIIKQVNTVTYTSSNYVPSIKYKNILYELRRMCKAFFIYLFKGGKII